MREADTAKWSALDDTVKQKVMSDLAGTYQETYMSKHPSFLDDYSLWTAQDRMNIHSIERGKEMEAIANEGESGELSQWWSVLKNGAGRSD